jgi:hypothetical protein
MYWLSNSCKGEGNGMVLSKSWVEGGWLPDQRGVLGPVDETVVTQLTFMGEAFWNKEIIPKNDEGKWVKAIRVNNPKEVACNKYIWKRKKIVQSGHTLQNPLQWSME